MKHSKFGILLAFLGVMAALGASPAPAPKKYNPGCTVPFEEKPKARPIDNACPNEGKVEDAKAELKREHEAQNLAKNMLCAVGAHGQVQQDPIPVSLATFDLLQQKVVDAEITFGDREHLPKDRTKLKDIATNPGGVPVGEGSYVIFVGYMLENHAADAESVNCSLPGVKNQDIHIALVGQGEKNPCKSVTAEDIPHYRPDQWYVTYYKDYYEELQKHPWRVKGQLFFDGSHRICTDPKRKKTDPLRRSSWEIHPVYAMDVCESTTVVACKADDESKWVPMSDWIKSH
jgi:hypothetical protein